VEKKRCGRCREVKLVSGFYKNRTTYTGYTSYCKPCTKVRNKREYQNPKVRQAALDRGKTPESLARMAEYRKTDAFEESQVKYRRSGKKAAYERNRYHTDPKFRVKTCFSVRMRQALRSRNTSKLNIPMFDILPYTLQDLIGHLEVRFLPGMTWENYGSKWHIDHVKADIHFKYASIYDKEFQESWSLENLQPLWGPDNLKKGIKMQALALGG